MEPERKIEKLLRAFGKKRRDDAGAPLELHPATRRLLQGEVARRAPKRSKENSFVALMSLLRPRLAFILPVAIIGLIVGVVVLPTLTGTKSKSRSLAMRGANESGEARADKQLATPAATCERDLQKGLNGADRGVRLETAKEEIATAGEPKNQPSGAATEAFEKRRQAQPAAVPVPTMNVDHLSTNSATIAAAKAIVVNEATATTSGDQTVK